MREVQVRIPRSALVRNEPTYAKLLFRVVREPNFGPWSYKGRIVKCGSWINETELRPDPTWPVVPVLLECAGRVPGVLYRADSGHKRCEDLYVLWRWDGQDWCEVCRMQSQQGQWCHAMRSVAAAELNGPVLVPRPFNPAPIVSRVHALITRECDTLDHCDRQAVAAALYESFAARVCSFDAVGLLPRNKLPYDAAMPIKLTAEMKRLYSLYNNERRKEKLSPERRSEIARNAALIRYGKKAAATRKG